MTLLLLQVKDLLQKNVTGSTPDYVVSFLCMLQAGEEYEVIFGGSSDEARRGSWIKPGRWGALGTCDA